MNIARSGIAAHSAGVAITGENITNVHTAGYVRRSARLEARVLGSVAGGVNFTGVDRAFDQFSYKRVLQETGRWGSADARTGALTHIENLIVPAAGQTLADRLNTMFTAFNELSLIPGDSVESAAARMAVIFAAQDVAQAFNETSNGFAAARAELLQQAIGVSNELNERLDKIAELNGKIEKLQGNDTSGRAELLDQRDELVREVSERIDVTVVFEESGAVTLLSSGASLVQGMEATQVQVSEDAAQNMHIEFVRGSNVIDVTARVDGGRLGGLREAREVDIPELQNDLDTFAMDLANAMNAVHSTGFGLNDPPPPPSPNRPLFTDAGGAPLPGPPGTAAAFTLNPVLEADHDNLAATSTQTDLPGGNDITLALYQIQDADLGAGGNPAERFGEFAGKIGNKLSGVQTELSHRASTVVVEQNMRESISGVSLDEEMVNLTKYQRAFEASMRVLQAADELLATLVQAV